MSQSEGVELAAADFFIGRALALLPGLVHLLTGRNSAKPYYLIAFARPSIEMPLGAACIGVGRSAPGAG
jgi:hypothetical protein